MKSKSVKSQVTLIIIVGLAIFIAVSLVLYLSTAAVKKQSKQSTKSTQESAIDTQPIKDFVTKCLDKLAKDAIVTLGKQGGYIYSSQRGTVNDYSDSLEGFVFVKDSNQNRISFNILNPPFKTATFWSEPPDYPWEKFPQDPSNPSIQIFLGYYGFGEMPPLYFSKDRSHSIQEQIETFVDNKMASCADFSIFKEQGYEIVMKPLKTSVIIGSNDVIVKSTIPITITNQVTKGSKELSDFSTNLNIRLKDVYFFIQQQIDRDTKDITFDINSPNNDVDSFDVQSTEKKLYNGVKADLVRITDTKSLIYGKPFEYVFARKNRAPALYYIRDTLNYGDCGKLNDDYSSGSLSSVIRAADPDEDAPKFNIIPVTDTECEIQVTDEQLTDSQRVKLEVTP